MKLQLIDNWTSFWKMYSVWAMAIAGLLPEIFEVLHQYGLVSTGETSGAMNSILKLVMVAGIVGRLVKQRVLEMQAAEPPADQTKK